MRNLLLLAVFIVGIANAQTGYQKPLKCADTVPTFTGSKQIVTIKQMSVYVGTKTTTDSTQASYKLITWVQSVATFVKKTFTINGTALNGTGITLTADQIAGAIVTPGNRTRAYVDYTDTLRITSTQILAGTTQTLIRAYGTDTTVVIYWICYNYTYKTAAYVSTGADTVKIKTTLNSALINAYYIHNPIMVSSINRVGFWPVAIDGKDQGAAWTIYIPHIYSVGEGSLWFRYKYYLVVRKLT
jgi:hypothetical protein